MSRFYKKIVGDLIAKLGANLYRSRQSNNDIAHLKLKDVQGKVIAVFDSEFQGEINAKKGIFPYYDVDENFPGKTKFASPNLSVYDWYANTNNLQKMWENQSHKLGGPTPIYNSNPDGTRMVSCKSPPPPSAPSVPDKGYGGYGKSYLFLLSWTLTGGAGKLNIEDLAGEANAVMPLVLNEVRNCKLNRPNIVYYDFVNSYLNRMIIDMNNMPDDFQVIDYGDNLVYP